jgi:hypothetical protein
MQGKAITPKPIHSRRVAFIFLLPFASTNGKPFDRG